MNHENKLVRVLSISHSYTSKIRGTIDAIRDVSLEVTEGELLALVGENGAGKTTLAKHLNGLLKPTTGKVYVNGRDTKTTTVAQLASEVGYVFQDPNSMIFMNTVKDELEFGPKNAGIGAAEIAARVDEVLDGLELRDVYASPPFLLTRAAKRRLALASVLTMKPRLIILDEPTVGQDRVYVDKLMRYILGLNRSEGLTVAVITHDMRLVAEYLERVVVLSQGQVVYDGRTRVLFSRSSPLLLEEAGLEAPQITQLSLRMPRYFPDPCLSVDEAERRLSDAVQQQQQQQRSDGMPPKVVPNNEKENRASQ